MSWRYERVPSAELRRALSPGGFLGFLLDERTVGGLTLDLHFRESDHVHLYCGLTRVLEMKFSPGGIRFRAHASYRNTPGAGKVLRAWTPAEYGTLREDVVAYLDNVQVADRYVRSEGRVQSLWSRVRKPWAPFDREAVVGYEAVAARRSARAFRAVSEAWSEVSELLRIPALSSTHAAELDQLAVDPAGQLVLLELKHSRATPASVYLAPLQLLQYVHEWHMTLPGVLHQLQGICEARHQCGLMRERAPKLTGKLRPVIAFAEDERSVEVRRRFELVREVANRHLPVGVPSIEVWCLREGKPALA